MSLFQKATFALLVSLVLSGLPAVNAQTRDRSTVDEKYTWALDDIYANDQEWKTAKDQLVNDTEILASYKGKLGSEAETLLEFLQHYFAFSKQYNRVSTYASMKSDQDLRDATYLAMDQELRQMGPVLSANLSFVDPEILAAGREKIDRFLADEPGLGIYRMYLQELFRQQEHLLSEPEEKIIAHSSSLRQAPYSVFSVFMNTELPFPEVTLSTGEQVLLNVAGYSKYRASANREDRELVFQAFYSALKGFQGTLAEELLAGVNANIFISRARNYGSALERALDSYNIPVEVYHSLVDNVNGNLPVFHRYLTLRKRLLGVDTLKYSDIYAPVVQDIDLAYTYDEARNLIIEALDPLGDDYQATVTKAFDERWIDVYPTTGKRSGAYSNGSVYDVHPYILLNFNGQYSDVSTIAHELGHTLQSYLSNKAQPYPLADYPIFTAEVASTFNECLLSDYMVKHIRDDETRLALLMSRLDDFKGTLFRQTQFAEFELTIHELAESGKPLTGDVLNQIYGDLLKKYYGHDAGICSISDLNAVEWAFIPHFYYDFYVYQYSTSFTASSALSEKVLSGDRDTLERYLVLLSSGGSDYPIEQLKKAGVDMTSSEPFNHAIDAMNRIMDDVEVILDRLGL